MPEFCAKAGALPWCDGALTTTDRRMHEWGADRCWVGDHLNQDPWEAAIVRVRPQRWASVAEVWRAWRSASCEGDGVTEGVCDAENDQHKKREE